MKILVTGSAGRLGRKLVPELIWRGHSVIAVDSVASTQTDDLRIKSLQLDLTDLSALDRTLDETRPDAVINCAAMTNVDACETQREVAYKVNATIPERLAKRCRKIDAQLIQVSTDYIFDGHAGPYDEAAHPTPIGYYGKSKLAGENAVLAESNHNAVARTCVLFGYEPSAAPDFVGWLLAKLRASQAVTIVTDQYSTPTLTDSLATGLRQIAEQKAHGIFHLVGSEYLNRYDFAIIIAKHFGLSEALIEPTDSSTFQQAAPRPMQGGLTTKHTVATIGFEPLSLSQALSLYFHQEARRN